MPYGRKEKMYALKAKWFDELTGVELYEILKSRATVFVKEQKINYVDEDDVEYESLHCCFQDERKMIAYLRAFRDSGDIESGIVRFGRVLTLAHGQGIGSELVKQSIAAAKEKFGCKKIKIAAQKHAERFYRRLGFVTTSAEYLEEGIAHVDMELTW